jgi:hypothetical protein
MSLLVAPKRASLQQALCKNTLHLLPNCDFKWFCVLSGQAWCCGELLLLVLNRLSRCCLLPYIHPQYTMGDHEEDEHDRPEKRQRLDEEQQHVAGQQQQQQAGEDDAAPPAPPPAHDQISSALAKLRNHLGNKNKFSKASGLLRQLLDAVDKVRGHNAVCLAHAGAAMD